MNETEIKTNNGDIFIIKAMESGISITKKECCTKNMRVGTRHGDQISVNDNTIYCY